MNFNVGASADQLVSVVSMDMNVGCVKNLQMVPGLTSNNSVAIVQKGGGADLGGVINSGGNDPIALNLNFAVDRREDEVTRVSGDQCDRRQRAERQQLDLTRGVHRQPRAQTRFCPS